MNPFAPPPVHGGGTAMILATLLAIVAIALLIAFLWLAPHSRDRARVGLVTPLSLVSNPVSRVTTAPVLS
ncbi:MAG: hypothetical protein AB7N65_19390 [Vicinamibacterales bacterium]